LHPCTSVDDPSFLVLYFSWLLLFLRSFVLNLQLSDSTVSELVGES
jgi:hypothetical protein